ncbi:hypothetical protein PWT90_06710 [Aphanocladium album]|nr:hypothetical protein PWT90_06710 [Aphanocladium album]
MFHTFHKASNKPSKVVRRRAQPACQACQQKKADTPSYDFGDGRMSPSSTVDSVESASTVPSPDTLASTTGVFEVPMMTFMEDSFLYNHNIPSPSEDTLWFNMEAFDGSSPKAPEISPLSPEGEADQRYLSDLSTVAISTQLYDSECSHSGMIERLLCDVMGPRWPAVPSSSSPAASTSTLSVLRDAVNQLHMLNKCVVCMSSCKSMALILVITKAVLEHATCLIDRLSPLDKSDSTSMQLGNYTADSDEECFFVYAQIIRRHIMKLAEAADCFAEAAQRAGWLAHVISLKDVADEARTLARSNLGII